MGLFEGLDEGRIGVAFPDEKIEGGRAFLAGGARENQEEK
jgi:hypothetical protein